LEKKLFVRIQLFKFGKKEKFFCKNYKILNCKKIQFISRGYPVLDKIEIEK